MVDLKKTLKKIAAIIALGATLGATGAVAYEGGMKRGAKGAFSHVAIVNLKNDSIAIKKFEMSMGYAKKTLEKGDIMATLDNIINANGEISEIKIMDTRELRARLLEVRMDLNKALKEKGVN